MILLMYRHYILEAQRATPFPVSNKLSLSFSFCALFRFGGKSRLSPPLSPLHVHKDLCWPAQAAFSALSDGRRKGGKRERRKIRRKHLGHARPPSLSKPHMLRPLAEGERNSKNNLLIYAMGLALSLCVAVVCVVEEEERRRLLLTEERKRERKRKKERELALS